jgi:hypothetical protein
MPRLMALSTFIVSKALLRISSPYLVVDELGDCFGVPHEIGIGRVFGRIVNEKVKIIHRDANTSVQYALLLKSQFCETQIHELGVVLSCWSQGAP